jgi:CDGSH-type Zn-finger protein
MAGMSSEDVVIVPYRDGPYLVRGPLVLRDQDGRAIDLTRRTVALCRCGKSRTRPFCDGTHRMVEFRAPSQAERPWPAPSDPTPPSPAAARSQGHHSRDLPSLAVTGLRRTRARVAGMLDRTCDEAEDLAIRAALPLIDGACRLLDEPTGVAAGRSEPAALHLIKGAFDALGDAADPARPGVAAAAAELAAVAVALEPRCNGSWP